MTGDPIPTGCKYALYALRTNFIAEQLPNAIELENGLSVLRDLPIGAPDHWQQWLGELQTRELSEASLCLLATAPSTALRDLDNENADLTERVNRFFFSLLIAMPCSASLDGMHLTGAAAESGPDVRRQGRLDAIVSTTGAELSDIDSRTVESASDLAASLEAIQQAPGFERLWRLVHALHAGMTSGDLGTRIHQFVRCVEGFLLPDIGKTGRQFVHRCQVFVGPHCRPELERLFNIRSAVEHLHDPLRAVDAADGRSRVLLLARCAHQAEAIARHCLSRVLANKALCGHFADDAAIRKFWKLGLAEQAQLWGEPLDFATVSGQFSADMAAMELRI